MDNPPLTKEEQIEASWQAYTKATVETYKFIHTEEFLLERYHLQGGLCTYCADDMILPTKPLDGDKVGRVATRDHIIPRNKGGRDEPDNITIACHECNNTKADIDIDLWHKWMEECPVRHDPPLMRQYMRLESREHLRQVARTNNAILGIKTYD